jgi:hypothetical protein
MRASVLRSETGDLGKKLQPHHYAAMKSRHISATEGRGARDIRLQQYAMKRLGLNPQIQAEPEKPHRTTAHWTSSYNATHGASVKASAKVPEQALVIEHQHDPNAHKHKFAQNLLRHNTGNSSYNYDFGLYGSDPRQRYDWRKGTANFSANATTRDLNDGTPKNSEHIPNTGVHIPAAPNNDNISQKGGRVPLAQKVNVLAVYNHNLPGYTGHRPSSVFNDHGPRCPESKVPFGVMRSYDLYL